MSEYLINPNFKDRVVAITGGGGILCSAMAKELGRQGMKVAILDLRQEAADEVANLINNAGGNAIGVACNVLEKESMESAKSKINSIYGEIDILINGAGGNNPKATTSTDVYNKGDETKDDINSFFKMTSDGFGFVFNLNFMGSFIPSQVFMSDLIRKEGGHIINISSMSANYPLTRVPAYSAAKAAINNFTMWLAVHFANQGLRVNAIAPGFFITDQNRSLLANSDGSLTERSNKIMAHTPLKRFGETDDLIGPLLWLLDNKASNFVTGHILPVDGGFLSYAGV